MGTNGRDLGPLVLAVAAELRAEQGRQGLKLRELATRSGMPHSTLSKSLNGLRMIDVEELAKIADGLSVEPAEIWRRADALLASGWMPDVGGVTDDSFEYTPEPPRREDHDLTAKPGTRKIDR